MSPLDARPFPGFSFSLRAAASPPGDAQAGLCFAAEADVTQTRGSASMIDAAGTGTDGDTAVGAGTWPHGSP